MVRPATGSPDRPGDRVTCFTQKQQDDERLDPANALRDVYSGGGIPTVLVAWISEILVRAIEPTAHEFGVSVV
jgi:hypothetical protein